MPRSRRFRLETDRLTIRMLERGDITAFVSYRNELEVARYQEWPLPYTRDLAHELVDEMDLLSGPTTGRWAQLALEHDGVLVGDVAIWLDDGADLAMIGYSLAATHQHQGYAVEATTAVVDWLFGRRRVHRIAATIDPRNLASARVLERCGFEHVGTARSAALARGEWTDDARFSLLPGDWKAWRRRPTGPPDQVELVEITAENVSEVTSVDRSFSQRGLVASVADSLAEALVPKTVRGERIRPWVRAVSADGVIAGFVMMAEPYAGRPDPYLWRLLIDRRHQGRGLGTQVVERIAADRRAAGDHRLRVSYVPDVVGSPERFYHRLGFEPTGEVHDGEVEAMLDLTARRDRSA